MSTGRQVDNNLLSAYNVKVTPSATGDVQHMTLDAGFVPPTYDQLILGYTGTNLTSVTYKLAGATVGTLTLSYDGSTLSGVVRT